ncbi:Cupredoxin [Pseudoneurospora amorphoporcata]|uniref:Cupredoxin n=1 Tax=Pseudoneurospora amorphoporcata TaxID=241081 RepID=A0AAN6SDM1_9PEZI|nr:Cupredoxin [Pseudoneurospora amorphoporcata]
MTAFSRIVLLTIITAAHAATVVYDFNVSWAAASPDGLAKRQVIGINQQWPPPRIDAQVGDRLIVNLLNSLGDQDTSLHFHGLFMNGSTHMDGSSMVTQCPIPPGASFTYNFTIDQPGTYWYHSHAQGQYPDGLRGPLIIHDPKTPFQYDQELVLTVSDWYHEPMSVLQPRFMSKYNPTGAEPIPNAALMNDTQNLTIPMIPERTYSFRMANIGAFAGQYIWIEGHNMTIVEMDGVYVHPTETSMIYLSAAQRCSFLVKAKRETSRNFPMIASMDTTLFDTTPPSLNPNVTSYLLYNNTAPLPTPSPLDSFTPLDDTHLHPRDNLGILPLPDQAITLNISMSNLASGANYAFFNNITYVAPLVPTLYTVLSSPNSSSFELTANAQIYGTYTHPYILPHHSIIQLVLNNLDTGRHPFHLHGHNFQVLHRSGPDEGPWWSTSSNLNEPSYNHTIKAPPMRRDTLLVEPNGNAVLRFRADNPGVWLFHCHIEWHMISGLAATFVEAPSILQRTLQVPEDHFSACKRKDGKGKDIPVQGNAAGRGQSSDADPKEWLVLDGQPCPPGELHSGFTRGGVVALAISCLTGLLGVVVVGWYGFSEPAAAVGNEKKESGENVSESGVYSEKSKSVGNNGAEAAPASGKKKLDVAASGLLTDVMIRRGTEAVESQAVSFGSEEEAVNAVGKGMDGNGKKRLGGGSWEGKGHGC